MIKKLIVFLFLYLLFFNFSNGQNNTLPKPKQDTLLFSQDSVNSTYYEHAQHLVDSILEAEKKEKDHLIAKLAMNRKVHLKYFDLPVNKILDFNGYEGFRFGFALTTNNIISKYFSVGGYFGYGCKDQKWKYGSNLVLNLHENSKSKLHFSYSNDVQEKAGYTFFKTKDYTSTEYLRRLMINDMDRVEKFETSFSFLSLQFLSTNLFFNQSIVEPTDSYRFGKDSANAVNRFTFNEIGIQFEYEGNLASNAYCVNLIKGVNWIDGEYKYTKYEAKIQRSFNLFNFGITKIAFVGGLVDGNIPISKLYNGHGSYQSFSLESENSFGTMRMNEFYSDKFVSIFFKHNFGQLFQTKISSPELAIVNNYGIATLSNKNYHIDSKEIKSYDKGYYECGLLINNILKPDWLGLGFGIFHRYGPYSFSKTADNFAYKLTLNVDL